MLTDAGQSRDELVDFLWEVARDGYRVVEVAPDSVLHTNAEAPDLPAGLVYQDPDQVMAEEAARRALPARRVPLLTTVAPDQDGLWVTRYTPLREHSALFRTFADLSGTPEVIVTFADRYGMLGGSAERRFVVTDSDRIGFGEPINRWRDAIRDMRDVVQAWDRARRDDIEGPPRWLGRDELRRVQRTVNARLSAETGAQLLWVADDGCLALRVRPRSLLGALWLQLAQAIDGNARYRSCRVCSAWFELHPDRARSDRAYCSNGCRFKAYRGRQARARELHSEGQDVETIARELGSDVETIRKWTGGSDG